MAKSRKHTRRNRRRAGVATRSGIKAMPVSPKKRQALTEAEKRERSIERMIKSMSGVRVNPINKTIKVRKVKAKTKAARAASRRKQIYEKHRQKVKSISPSDLFSGMTI